MRESSPNHKGSQYDWDPKTGAWVERKTTKGVRGFIRDKVATPLKNTVLMQTFQKEQLDLSTPGQTSALLSDFSVAEHSQVVSEPGPLGSVKRFIGGGEKYKVQGQEQERIPRLDRVYMEFSKWWTGHAHAIIRAFPGPDGPGEKHPMFYQWQMAKSITGPDGRVIAKTLAEKFEDPDFYNKTMLYIEHEATMKAHALGIATQMKETKLGFIKRRRNSLGDKVLVPYGSSGVSPLVERTLLGGLEAEAGLVFLVNAIYFAASVGGYALPAGFLAAFNPIAAAVAIGAVGLAASKVITVDGLNRMIRSFKSEGEMDHLLKVCKESLAVIKSDKQNCDYMAKVYGVNPNELDISGQSLTFTEGSTSVGWREIQKDLQAAIKLRELFLTDCVVLERRAAKRANRAFVEMHALTEEFITRNPTGSAEKLVANQSGARYQADWLLQFEKLRAQAKVPLDSAHIEELQQLYMEAGRQLLSGYATEMFTATDETNTVSDQDVWLGEDAVSLGNKINMLDRRITLLKPPDANGKNEGAHRARAKKQANERLSKSKALIDGKVAEGIEPAKKGLHDSIKAIAPDTEGSLMSRKNAVEEIYNQLAETLHTQNISASAREVREKQSVASLEAAIIEVRAAREKITHPITGEIAILEDARIAAQAKSSARRIEIVTDPGGIYKGVKGGPKQQELDLASHDATWQKAEDGFTKELQKLNDRERALQSLLEDLNVKVRELRGKYEEMSYSRQERSEIIAIPGEMKIAYETIVVTSKVPETDLVRYGETGFLMADLLAKATIRPWPIAEDDKHERGMTFLHAVAEARARRSYKNKTGGSITSNVTIHGELVNKSKGGLTPEQLVTMSVQEIFDRMAKKTSLTNYAKLTSDDIKMNVIRNAQQVEVLRYEIRQKALQETIVAHERVNGVLTKQITEIDEQCDRVTSRLELMKSFIGDRATHYREAPYMRQHERLEVYADGMAIDTSPSLKTDDERNRYLTFERNSALPRGLIEFLRDVFKYDVDEVGGLSEHDPQKLFVTLLECLNEKPGVNRRIANIIVKSIPYFSSMFNPYLTLSTPLDLDFTQVMNILSYYANPAVSVSLPWPPPYAKPITHADPITMSDMKKVIQGISVTILDIATGSSAAFTV